MTHRRFTFRDGAGIEWPDGSVAVRWNQSGTSNYESFAAFQSMCQYEVNWIDTERCQAPTDTERCHAPAQDNWHDDHACGPHCPYPEPCTPEARAAIAAQKVDCGLPSVRMDELYKILCDEWAEKNPKRVIANWGHVPLDAQEILRLDAVVRYLDECYERERRR